MLNIVCTPEEDIIAVRLDATAAWVQVLGEDDQLLAQFPAADVEGVRVNGLLENDRFEMDVALPLVATFGSHHHGGTNPANADQPTSIGGEDTLGDLLLAALALGEHSFHNAQQVDTLLSSHFDHGFTLQSVDSATGVSSLIQNHGHSTTHATAAHSATETKVTLQESSSLLESMGGSQLRKHDDHVATEVKSQISKWCTTTYTGKNAILADQGERKCNCAKKQKAAEDAAKKVAAVEEHNSAAESRSDSPAICPACQRQSLAFGLPDGPQTCSVLPLADHGLSILDGDRALVESRQQKPSNHAENLDSSQSPWLDGLQLAGWSLIAASAALLPVLLEKRKRRVESVASIDRAMDPGFDWLSGRFQVELLTR